MVTTTPPTSSSSDICSFYTTKLTRWKGNYPRIFTIHTHGLTTYNSDSEPTNSWQWTDVFSLTPLSTPDHPSAFTLTHRKGKTTSDFMRFECEHRAELLTASLAFLSSFGRSGWSEGVVGGKWEGGKFCHASPHPTPTTLTLTPTSLTSWGGGGAGKKVYFLKDLDAVIELAECGVFALRKGQTGRLHTFTTPTATPTIIAKLLENATHYLGHSISYIKSVDPVDTLLSARLGLYSDDRHLISLAEFTLQNSTRARILLCLSETCLLERDAGSYAVTSLFPLESIFCLVRCVDDGQAIGVELSSGVTRTYYSTERDALLASLVDGTRAGGNTAIHVTSCPTPLGKRWGPLSCPVDEKVETLFLKFLHQPPPTWTFHELLLRFNANVEYSGLIHASSSNGLFAENKEKLILVGINSLLMKDVSEPEAEDYFQLVRRLVCSKTGFAAFSEMERFREKLGSLVVTSLRNKTSELTIHSALEVISALMQPMHSDSDLRVEQENKEKVLNSAKFMEGLLQIWVDVMKRGTGALVTLSMLDILTFALCAPYSETTMGGQFDSLLNAVAGRAGVLFTLFQHPSIAIVKGAGLLTKALIEEGQANIASLIQSMALSEGALIRHLLSALFVTTSDRRLLTLRQLSRHLITLWTSSHPLSKELLGRIFPPGLLLLLASTSTPPDTDPDLILTRDPLKLAQNLAKAPSHLQRQVRNVEKYVEKQIESALKHWRLNTALEARKNVAFRPVVLRKRRQNLVLEGNWSWFYYGFGQDHSTIWNFQTREELRVQLQNEIRLLDNDREHIRGEICWNYSDFSVDYRSLSEEIRVGGYYLRLLLEADTPSLTTAIHNPKEFFGDLYHRFLLTGKPELRGMCLEAMTIVYGHHVEEIGVFGELKFIVLMLERSLQKTERDRLVLFLKVLTLHPENARELVSCGGLKVLVDLITLAHLHTSRPHLPAQSNVIEAGSDMKQTDSPEWFYMKKGEKVGPVGFGELLPLLNAGAIDAKTKMWANGLDSWKAMSAIPQCKWFLLSAAQPSLMNESKLASVILDIFITILQSCPAKIGEMIVRPVHKAKQILTEPSCLPHIVQVLLTFEPGIVERVGVVLGMLLEENPFMSRVYATGVYFFIMMYVGSNILPISRFLHLTHLKQNTYSAQQGTSIWQKSVLGSLLPEAMVAFLENHGVEKFSETFLGEFDTPEAIWSASMRRYLIERIALHLADFTPRLLSNTRAIYDYCAIPAIAYEVLEPELFCGVFYLRNLTDERRFPDWPISDPLSTLRDVLEAWKCEVEKKPPPMTVTEALRALELDENEENWGEQVKRNYRKLAQKFHPDKNPAGRERFEAANKAYEFLCSRYSSESANPDVNRIVLILKTQSILFKRHSDVLSPYKYSGYPMLIKTIQLDVADEGLFAQENPLLPHSVECTFWTLNCSALNVEELRREKGLELLLAGFDRCVSVLSKSSKVDDMAVSVCMHVTKCFSVATMFQLCRDKLVEMPLLAKLLCQMFNFKHLTKLLITAADCVAAMSVDTILQMQLLQSGVLWHLLASLFCYDFSLEESSVDANEDSNLQILVNNFSKSSVLALKSLCGDEEGVRPKNDVIRLSLEKLLLPFGLRMILTQPPEHVLKLLNSNNSSPQFIWNNSTRSELLEYCDAQLSLLKNGENDMSYGSDFSYSVHEGELVIGSIFIRIYTNSTAFSLEQPSAFIAALLSHLSTTEGPDPVVIDALALALKSNPGLEVLCKGKFRLFARLMLAFPQEMLGLVGCLFGSQECVGDCVGSGVLVALCVVSAGADKEETLLSCLGCLEMLAAHGAVVKEGLRKGLPLYLLTLLTNPTLSAPPRTASAAVLSRLLADKISGPRIKILLEKLLPPIFTSALSESPASAIALYDSSTESPELCWDDEGRSTLLAFLSAQFRPLHAAHSRDLSADWTTNIDALQNIHQSNSLLIGGIYLRVYAANPNWNLRRPREFAKDLLEFVFMSLDQDNAPLVRASVHILFSSQPHLIEGLGGMGYVNKILAGLSSTDPNLRSVCGEIFRFFGRSPSLVAGCGGDSLRWILGGLKYNEEAGTGIVGVTCEGLNGVFGSGGVSDFVGVCLRGGLVEVLLGWLKGRDWVLQGEESGGGTHVASVKANIVHALQGMGRDEIFGGEVREILGRSAVWSSYSEQKHDLFLGSSSTAGYLMQGSGSVTGYLTQGPESGKKANKAPPPLVE